MRHPAEVSNPCGMPNPDILQLSIKIRAAHEIMTAGATQLALVVLQFVPAARTPAPMLARSI
jgi:hypothetical protein